MTLTESITRLRTHLTSVKASPTNDKAQDALDTMLRRIKVYEMLLREAQSILKEDSEPLSQLTAARIALALSITHDRISSSPSF